MKDYSSHIGIIGGGIAGLTAGCALRLEGINSVIFERNESINEHGAGISISPNGLMLLKKLGIDESLLSKSFTPKKVVMRYLNKEMRSFDVQVVTSSRQKLLQVIQERYIALGGEILFGHKYEVLNQDSCEVVFKNNQTYKVAHVLACDGIKSPIRQKYFPSSEKPIYSGYKAWRSIGLSTARDIQFYFGPGTHIVTYPIDDKDRTSFVGIVKSKEVTKDSWRVVGSKAQLLEDFKFYDKKIFSMIDSDEDIYQWSIYIRPPLKSLCSHNITLLGDAAHPMVPFLGQGGCMAIEDAYTFGRLAGKLSCDFKKVQALYEKVRLKRNNKIQSSSMIQGRLNHLKNPIFIFVRNLFLRFTPIISIRTKKIWGHDAEAAIRKVL